MSPDNKNTPSDQPEVAGIDVIDRLTPQSGAVSRVLKVIESCVSIILGRVKCLNATFSPRTLSMWADASSCVH
jgi:hypothetical protein